MISTPALAAQRIISTALSLAFLPALAFSIAATVLVEQSIGARTPEDAQTASRIALRWALVWMGIGGAVAFIIRRARIGRLHARC
jgi:Na+-driven multidrug efflux pump